MEIKVQQVVEHEDGSATLMIDMDAETRDYMVNYALIDIIRKGLAEVEQLNKDKSDGNVEL
jgi:hypothetical protein